MSFELVAAPGDGDAVDTTRDRSKFRRNRTDESKDPNDEVEPEDKRLTRIALREALFHFPEVFKCEERKTLFKHFIHPRNIGSAWVKTHRRLCREELAKSIPGMLFLPLDWTFDPVNLLAVLNDPVFVYDERYDERDDVKKEIGDMCRQMREGVVIDDDGEEWTPTHLVNVAQNLPEKYESQIRNLGDGENVGHVMESYSRLYTGEKRQDQTKNWYDDFKELIFKEKPAFSPLDDNTTVFPLSYEHIINEGNHLYRENVLTKILKVAGDMMSVSEESEECYLLLFNRFLELGVDPNEPNGDGETPFYIALRHSMYAYATALFENSRFEFKKNWSYNGSFVYGSYHVHTLEEDVQNVGRRWTPMITFENPLICIFRGSQFNESFWNNFFEKHGQRINLNEQIIQNIEYEYDFAVSYPLRDLSLLEYGLLKMFYEPKKQSLEQMLKNNEQSLKRILFLGKNGKTFSENDIQEHEFGTQYLYGFLIRLFHHAPVKADLLELLAANLELLAECKDAITGLIPEETLTRPMNQLLNFGEDFGIDKRKSLTTDMVATLTNMVVRLRKMMSVPMKKNLTKFFTVLKERFSVVFDSPDGHGKRPFDYVSEVVGKNKDALDEDHAVYRANVEFLVATLFKKCGMDSAPAYASLTNRKIHASTSPGFMFLCDLIARFGREPTEEEKIKILNVPIPPDCEKISSFRERVRGYGS
jgi:hypothetical protein